MDHARVEHLHLECFFRLSVLVLDAEPDVPALRNVAVMLHSGLSSMRPDRGVGCAFLG